MNRKYLYNLYLFVAILVATSCGVSKKVMREQQFLEKDLDSLAAVDNSPIRLEVGDFVNISVFSQGMNQDQVLPFIIGGISNEKTSATHQIDYNGFITMPVIGKIKAQGLTSHILADSIKQKVELYVKNPGVVVRYVGINVKVLGQVNKQGLYSFNSENVNIFDALSAASGINELGQKDSILVIRESNNKRTLINLDLTSSKVFGQEGFRLKSNDIVLVKTNNQRQLQKTQELKDRKLQNSAMILNILLVGITIFTLLSR